MCDDTLEDWKRRCRDGEEIPCQAIVDHGLTEWFMFMPIDEERDVLKRGVLLAFAEVSEEQLGDWGWKKYDDVTKQEDMENFYHREKDGTFTPYPRAEDGRRSDAEDAG